VDQGRTPSEARRALGGASRRGLVEHRVLGRWAAPFAVALVAVAAFVALVAGVLGQATRGEIVIAFALLVIAGAAGLRAHRHARQVHAGAVEYRSIVETAPEAFISADSNGCIVEWNRQAEEEFGWSRDEVVGGLLAETIVPPRLRDAYNEGISRLLQSGDPESVNGRLELRALHRDGHEFPVEVTVSGLRTASGARFNAFVHDISERKEAEARLAHQAMHDPLTGLPNRLLFTDRMRLAIARLMRGGSMAVLFCDLDRFKAVNDDLGHEAGDRVLLEAADRLLSTLRPSDTVARFGGDEFAVLCEDVDAEAAELIASRIGSAFSEPFGIDTHDVLVTMSIGIALTTDPGCSPEQLVSDADFAMYAAKQGGRAQHVVFRRRLRRPPAFTSAGRRARRTGSRGARPSPHS
jgi:diguanylate cyclase (GGDEF)-like protein/PAS domain S-box-containing protein